MKHNCFMYAGQPLTPTALERLLMSAGYFISINRAHDALLITAIIRWQKVISAMMNLSTQVVLVNHATNAAEKCAHLTGSGNAQHRTFEAIHTTFTRASMNLIRECVNPARASSLDQWRLQQLHRRHRAQVKQSARTLFGKSHRSTLIGESLRKIIKTATVAALDTNSFNAARDVEPNRTRPMWRATTVNQH